MGSSNSKPDSETTLDWDRLKTNDFSSTMPNNFNGLSHNAKQLIASLNIPEIVESEASEFTINHYRRCQLRTLPRKNAGTAGKTS